MAFAVSQLHECGMTHNNIATKYFKVRLGFCSCACKSFSLSRHK